MHILMFSPYNSTIVKSQKVLLVQNDDYLQLQQQDCAGLNFLITLLCSKHSPTSSVSHTSA